MTSTATPATPEATEGQGELRAVLAKTQGVLRDYMTAAGPVDDDDMALLKEISRALARSAHADIEAGDGQTYPHGLTTADHIAHDMKAGRFPQRSSIGTFIAELEAGAPAGDAVAKLKARIDTRLNNALCEMKPDYDDSIHGFNEAWDIVSKAFTEALAHPSPPIDGLERLTAEQRELEGDARTLRGYIKEFGETPSMTASRASLADARLAASEAAVLALTTALRGVQRLANPALSPTPGLAAVNLKYIAKRVDAALSQAQPTAPGANSTGGSTDE